ncbi:DoxX family protein [Hymenobacter radiodurans]|uniref:DoxX family protein n=1 Tax=Hymenobacter radiodurans TaxID=2496028 RepID=UPI001058EF59|nr:MauE/DoxX family redox-associated membrane protein [Hymenobacter radiodurans]
MARFTTVSRYTLGLLLVVAGVLHFVVPTPYVRIMPPYLPAPLMLVYLSGLCEIGLGIGLLFRRTKRWAAWGTVALFIAVLPANVYMAQANDSLFHLPAWLVWGRLPLQLVLIAWTWNHTRKAEHLVF